MQPFYDYHPTSWVLIPTISLTDMRCEDPNCPGCDGATMATLDFLAWSVGIIF